MKQKYYMSIRRRGFTLIEVIVVVAILVLIAGALAPLTAQAIASGRNDATRAMIQQFADASVQFGKDVLRPPRSIEELKTNVHNVAGWNGPYTSSGFDQAGPGSPHGDLTNDAFGRGIEFISVSDTSIRVVSRGEDGILNNTDDISALVDVTPSLRAETLQRLAIINSAILQYNSTHLPTNPLPSNWTAARQVLISQQYLPSDNSYLYDAWGDIYVADPAGSTPLVKMKSSHVASTHSGC